MAVAFHAIRGDTAQGIGGPEDKECGRREHDRIRRMGPGLATVSGTGSDLRQPQQPRTIGGPKCLECLPL
jgi:hypothetical protein